MSDSFSIAKTQQSRGVELAMSKTAPLKTTEKETPKTPQSPKKEIQNILKQALTSDSIEVMPERAELQYDVNNPYDTIIMKIKNSETKELITEIPPEVVLKMSKHIKEYLQKQSAAASQEVKTLDLEA